MNAIQKESYEWFKKELQKVSSKKDAETYNIKKPRKVTNGSIFLFSYPNPKTPIKILKYFDKFPMVIILEQKGRYMLGLNLHWTPKRFRDVILKFIIKQNKQNIKNDKRFKIDFTPLKEFLKRNGLYEICIKKYIVARISNLEYVKYQDWKYVSELPIEKFITSAKYTQADVERLIMSHASKTRKSKSKRFS